MLSSSTVPRPRRSLAVAWCCAFVLMTSAAGAPQAIAAEVDAASMRAFDFEFGTFQVQHRVKTAAGTWTTFESTCTTRPFMNGQGNIEEHVFTRPTGVTYGTAIRAVDPATGIWAIWWVDSRFPHLPLDPPVKGRFTDGVGTFLSDSVADGKTVTTRFIWSQITATSAHWEQATSTDHGATWDTNWIMEFRRPPA